MRLEEHGSSSGRRAGHTLPRVIAFYLPQFHPIPENDAWWGKGFTEWTNVAKANPLFKQHYQPHLPADLGFYDLRLPEAREAQANLASEHGLYGFCYYHYWFQGRLLLERPFNDVLTSGRPDFPFCLCWANESWSRTWLGEERQILIQQTYSEEDDWHHAKWLAAVFRDPRYIRHTGRPVFLLYSVPRHQNAARFCEILRETCNRTGEKTPYLIGADSHCPWQDTRQHGFDTTLHFEPQLSALPQCFSDGWSVRRFIRNLQFGVLSGRMKLYDYREGRRLMKGKKPIFLKCHAFLSAGITPLGAGRWVAFFWEVPRITSQTSCGRHLEAWLNLRHKTICCSSMPGMNGQKETTLSRTNALGERI